MKYNVLVSTEAENDIRNAFIWYEDKRIGLGLDFLLHIDAGIRFIKRNPHIYKSEYKNTKKHLVKRFPYKIIYLTQEKTVFVLAVIHTKRNPKLTKERLRSDL